MTRGEQINRGEGHKFAMILWNLKCCLQCVFSKAVAKVWAPTGVYFAGFKPFLAVAFGSVVSIESVKSVISLLGMIVTICCTFWVARSQVKKNEAEIEKAKRRK